MPTQAQTSQEYQVCAMNARRGSNTANFPQTVVPHLSNMSQYATQREYGGVGKPEERAYAPGSAEPPPICKGWCFEPSVFLGCLSGQADTASLALIL